MLRSLTFRLALTYVAASFCMILVVAAGFGYGQLQALRDAGQATIDPVFSRVRSLISEQLNKGKPMSEAASVAWKRARAPQMYDLVAYDSESRRVYYNGPKPGDLSFSDRVLYDLVVGSDLYRNERLALQGRVFVDLDDRYIMSEFETAFKRQIPFLLVALLLAAGFSWPIARRATAPLRDITADLQLCGHGALVKKDLSYSRGAELDVLYASYNDAVENARRARSEREASGENMRTFISDASHELKTPLTIVMGYIDALAEGLVTRADDSKQILLKTLNECRRMRDTIEKLLSLARLERTEADIGTLDVAAVARDVVDSMRAVAPRITTEIPPDEEAMALGNTDEIREAIVTVVDNAVKYARGAPIDISVSRKANVAVLEVADLGPGMSPKERERAFDRFYRGNAAKDVNGSGLGLAIAKRAAERANGRITLNSELGRGTTVTFYLCAATSPD